MSTFKSNSQQETEKIASALSSELKDSKLMPNIICLYGNLGAGKTVFAKGFCRALGVPENQIKSPTYTFVREYQGTDQKIFHFDFYRILEGDDTINHEVEAILEQPNTTAIIEWPDRIRALLQKYHTKNIVITYINENERQIDIS